MVYSSWRINPAERSNEQSRGVVCCCCSSPMLGLLHSPIIPSDIIFVFARIINSAGGTRVMRGVPPVVKFSSSATTSAKTDNRRHDDGNVRPHENCAPQDESYCGRRTGREGGRGSGDVPDVITEGQQGTRERERAAVIRRDELLIPGAANCVRAQKRQAESFCRRPVGSRREGHLYGHRAARND